MSDKLMVRMMIHIITPEDISQWCKRLDIQLNEKKNNQNSIKVSKVVKSTNKKT